MRQVSSKPARTDQSPSLNSKASTSIEASSAALSQARPVWHEWLACTLLLAITAIAYANSLDAPFLLDDSGSIEQNPTIRDLTDFSRIWRPIGSGNTVQGRPLLNFSFALNYAMHGPWPTGFRVVNIAIHAINAMLLYALVRHTLLHSNVNELLRQKARGIALLCAAIWVAHPLQTESVTYIVQRAESLATMFWLATLTSFAFWITRQRVWLLAVATSCAVLGAASKEIAITAPLAILLYDRVFFARSWRDLWKSRGRAHATTWLGTVLVIGVLMSDSGGRGGTAGVGLGMSSWHYFLTSIDAVAMYLKLCVWPDPLVFDYGTDLVTDPRQVVGQGVLVFGLAIGGLIAGWRWPWIGFLTLLFAATLAPTSSVIPVLTQTRAEHRMYLPLAMLVVAIVVGIMATSFKWSPATANNRWLAIPSAAIVIALISLTALRNRDYRDEQTIWRDTAQKRPQNDIAQYMVALTNRLTSERPPKEAERIFLDRLHELVEQRPNSSFLHLQYAQLLVADGQLDLALHQVEAAEQTGGKPSDCHFLRATIAQNQNDFPAALEAIDQALRTSPVRSAELLTIQGEISLKAGLPDEALLALDEAVTLAPHATRAISSRAKCLFAMGQQERALEDFQRCIGYDPDNASHYDNLAAAYVKLERIPEAVEQMSLAIELEPNHVVYRCRRARLLAFQTEHEAACADLDAAIAADPEYVPAYEGRAVSRFAQRDFAGCLEDCEAIRSLGGQPSQALVLQAQALRARTVGSR
jgi:tetratricopeptide (TPR) repeat protein